MSDDLFVTVGIPTCDNADTVGRTLRSLLDAERQPDRILVVDASSDDTPEVIERVAAEYDVPVDCYRQSDEGRGVGAARQDIYERFDGDLLACLDTEVAVDDDWLAEHVAFHREHPDVDVLSAAPMAGVDGPVTDPKRGFWFQQANCTVKREALARIDGWDRWLPRGEDWDAQIRLWRSGADAYARSDLDGESMTDETPAESLRKTWGRPSSVAFVRKYGRWYVGFHPEHVLGDVGSVGALGLLVLGLFALPTFPPLGLVMLALAALPTLPYLYLKKVKHRDGGFIREDAYDAARFYLLGVTAARELLVGTDRPWNYGGCDGPRG
ncbi:glycosyltransferase [Halorarius halobius]|uniref:glycosyltransferase n=1 Tax=Halorarius halobius TaxID=2962671 RepID=UPI0020CECBF4|nr:glycosyltransferase family A protein [Halorarius halobius]